MTLIIKSEDLAGLISLEEATAAVETAYRSSCDSSGLTALHTRLHHEGRRLTVHPGGSLLHGTAGAFLHYERVAFGDAAQSYDHVGRRVYVAYETETSALLALVLGSLPLFPFDPPEAYGTETAITSAVGTKALARPQSRTLGLIGTGRQAARHAYILCRIFPIERIFVFSRSRENRSAFCRSLGEHVRAELRPVDCARDAVRDADIVVCATASNEAVLDGRDLARGAHVTSIVNGNRIVVRPGEPPRYRRELDDHTAARADVFCTVLREQGRKDGQGDLCEPIERGLLSWEKIVDLGPVLAGISPGRRSDDEITVFKQNSDQGVGFMALARLAHDKAKAAGVGLEM